MGTPALYSCPFTVKLFIRFHSRLRFVFFRGLAPDAFISL